MAGRAAVAAGLLAVLAAAPAVAAESPGRGNGLHVCNRTDEPVSLAVGFRLYVVDKDSISTKGWFHIQPGECQELFPTLEKAVDDKYFYYHASTSGGVAQERGNRKRRPLCVNAAAFGRSYRKDDKACWSPGDEPREFSTVNVSGASSYTINLERIERPAVAASAPSRPVAPARTYADVTDRDDPSSWSPEKQARYRAFERGMGSQ